MLFATMVFKVDVPSIHMPAAEQPYTVLFTTTLFRQGLEG
jgi:hypothetical protein